MRRLALLGLGLLIGCGAGGSGDDDDDITTPDAGGPRCDMQATASPASPTAPATIVVTASIFKESVVGIETFDWSVDRSGTPIDTTPRDVDGREIEFDATVAGPYRVQLSGSVGDTDCSPYSTTINVTDPGANEVTFRLALVPPQAVPAPPQLQTVTVSGGADFDIGARNLVEGLLVSGTLQTPGGTAVGGYLRAVATADPVLAIPREGFAAGDGSFQLRLLPGDYDVLIVPDGSAAAPAQLTGVTATSLTGALALPAADVVTGTVLRADDSPVVGARVALTIDGVPSTIATTDAAGAFSVLAHAGGATSLSVVPADGSLPQLDVAADAGLVADPGAPLAIRYAAPAGARTESFALVAADGSTPVPAGAVTFVARGVAGAGTVTPQGGSAVPATGIATIRAVADGTGTVGPVQLPFAVYDAVVTPALGAVGADSPRVLSVDLTAGAAAPGSLSLAAAASIGADVSGAPSGTRVTAVPRGALARASVATVESEIVAPGRLELSLVGGGSYDVTVHAPAAGGRAPVRLAVTAPAAGAALELDAIALPNAISITGTVESPDIAGGVDGVTVVLLCGDCAGEARAVPIAETVSGAGGAFTLLVPDPGVAE